MHNHSIIRIAAAACTLLLAGCTARLDPAEDGTNICFTAGSALLRDDEQTTKSEPYPAGTSFGVFAYKGNMNSSNNNLAPSFMFNVEVAYNGAAYTYSPIRFWPDVSEKLTFWAYSPYSASPVIYKANTTTAFSSTTKGIPDIQYTADGQTDFLVSDIVKNQTKNSNSGLVVMPFNHALSKVDVTVNKDDPTSKYTVKLKAVRFDGIYSTAILRSSEWTDHSGARGNLVLYADDPADATDDITLTASAQSLPTVIPLPQDLNNAAARLHVEFTVSFAGISHERTTAREVLLSKVFENAGARWDRNAHYTLELTISPDDPIEFTVSWSNWGDVFNYNITG